MTREQIVKKSYLKRAFHIANRLIALEEINKDMNNSENSPRPAEYRKRKYRIKQILSSKDNIDAESRRLRNSLNEINSAICSVNDIELRNILFFKYMESMTISEIAEFLNYDERTIQRKHLQALDALILSRSDI